MEGWITLQRKMLEWEWYSNINVKIVFLHLLLTANYKDKKWKGIEIKRGQVVTSYSNLADDVGLTVRQVRCAIDKLKMTNEITTKPTNKYTLITIEKYNYYQNVEQENDIQNDTQDDKQMTNKGQTNDNQMTIKCQQHNKDNNINKDNKETNNTTIALSEAEASTSDTAKASKQIKHKYGAYKNVLLKDQELQALQKDFSNWEELIIYLDEYIEMKGTKYKSHYMAIRKWVVDAVKRKNNKNTNIQNENVFFDILRNEGKME